MPAQTRPCVVTVHHGTDAAFSSFSCRFLGAAHGKSPISRKGFHFTDDAIVARTFGARILTCQVTIAHPLIIDADGADYPSMKQRILTALSSKRITRCDGIILQNYRDSGLYSDEALLSNHYVAFDEQQIAILSITESRQ